MPPRGTLHPSTSCGAKDVEAPGGAPSPDRSLVFVLVLAVPALLVVVLGYVVGHGLWTWLAGAADAAFGTSLLAGAEVAGWVTGLLGLAGVVRWALVKLRWGRTRRE
jgi:hypothetical protein